ncbi:MAG: FAD-dependent monooxygenase [Oscillospiraceae bacterium]
MLKLEGLKLTPEEKEAALHRKAARLLRIPEEDVLSVQVLRRSIDAREELHLVYTVAAEVRQEKQVLRRCRDRRVSRYAPERYALPEILSPPEVPPVVVGAGPGGLFAALVLARCGLRPILLERGRDTTARQRDVETFWRTGVLDPESNVQFGEGGAGAFSDGKLNTGTKDLRHRWILEELVRCGAPESILTDAKPHVGTDMLHIALQNLRQELLSLGAQMRFGHRLEGLESREGVLTGLHVRAEEETYRLPVRAVVLAPGHSARDTFQMLYEAGDPHGGQALCRGGPHRAPPAGHGRRPVPAVCGSSVSAGLHL